MESKTFSHKLQMTLVIAGQQSQQQTLQGIHRTQCVALKETPKCTPTFPNDVLRFEPVCVILQVPC